MFVGGVTEIFGYGVFKKWLTRNKVSRKSLACIFSKTNDIASGYHGVS